MRNLRSRIQGGFTLVEMMLALTLGAVVLTLILSSFRSLSTSMAATGRYRDMHHDVRHTMDVMQRDITRGSGISEYLSTGRLALTTTYKGSNQVSVVYNLSSNILSRTEGSSSAEVLAEDVKALGFVLYDASGEVTTDATVAYFVEVNLAMETRGVRETYEDQLRTRIRMRSKGL